MEYELYYHAANPGRGEFIRLPLEEAKADYVDVAREPGGAEQMMRFIQDAAVTQPQFAPPFLRHGGVIVGQTANILLYLGGRLGLAPEDEAGRIWAHQLQLTMADLVHRSKATIRDWGRYTGTSQRARTLPHTLHPRGTWPSTTAASSGTIRSWTAERG